MLSAEQKQEIESTIREQLKEVDARIAEYRELTKPIAPENAIGRVSRMDAINNKSVNEAALRTAESKKAKLELALKKIDEPYFGTCTSCGNAIPIGRVMLIPQSNKCVRCAQ
jgi:DnaK suppressor protein